MFSKIIYIIFAFIFFLLLVQLYLYIINGIILTQSCMEFNSLHFNHWHAPLPSALYSIDLPFTHLFIFYRCFIDRLKDATHCDIFIHAHIIKFILHFSPFPVPFSYSISFYFSDLQLVL